jgi:hypothetical protein
MHKQIEIGKYWINFGFSLRTFNLGIGISRGYITLDLAFVWIGIEF